MSTLAHDAFVYDSDARFTEMVAPFVGDGVAAGEHVCVVTTPHNQRLLRDALGGTADEVTYVDATEWYRVPTATIAAYARILREASGAGAPAVRVVGEVEFGDTPVSHAEWTRYEAILNAAFADQPAWIVCPYDARRLPEHVVRDAHRTHPHVVDRGGRHRSARYDAASLATSLPLAVEGAPSAAVDLADGLAAVRRLVGEIAARAGLRERAAEMTLAVCEIASNALVHGARPGRVAAWETDDAVVYEVSDHGGGLADPTVGFVPPRAGATGGAGIWLARQLADRVEIVPAARGAVVRLAFGR
jgi:anti-sigma regulatory factor (Ser/Thr protein kinase)